MSKKLEKSSADNHLFGRIAELVELARQKATTAVNPAMVHTYFEIGKMIVEDEQQGKEKAEYGKAVLKGLSDKLTEKFGKGFSVENLDRMRFFYKTYSNSISSTPLTKFTLSWSHYLIRNFALQPKKRRARRTDFAQRRQHLPFRIRFVSARQKTAAAKIKRMDGGNRKSIGKFE